MGLITSGCQMAPYNLAAALRFLSWITQVLPLASAD